MADGNPHWKNNITKGKTIITSEVTRRGDELGFLSSLIAPSSGSMPSYSVPLSFLSPSITSVPLSFLSPSITSVSLLPSVSSVLPSSFSSSGLKVVCHSLIKTG